MTKQATYQQLDKLLSQEIECAKDLLELLTKERNKIASSPEELTSLASEKQTMLGQMEQLSSQRNSTLKQANFETKQIEECINWCTANTGSATKLSGSLSNPLYKKWKSLLTTIDKCRQYNQTNGSIINSSQKRIRQSLAILHGQNPTNIAYSASGKTIDSGAHRTIAKA